MTGVMSNNGLYEHARRVHTLPAPSRYLRSSDEVKQAHIKDHRLHPWTHSHADPECMNLPTKNIITIEIDGDTFDFLLKGDSSVIFEFSTAFGDLINATEFGEKFGRALAKLQERGLA